MKRLLLKYRYSLVLVAAILAVLMVYTTLSKKEPVSTTAPKPFALTQQDLDWIEQNPVITVGVDLDFAPIEDLDENKNYIGVTADFLSLVSEKTGLVFEFDHEHSWEQSLERIKAGEIHMLGAAVASEQRRQFMDFTHPYAWLSGVIIVRKDVTEPMSLEKLKGMKVTVVHNYIWKDILETSHPELSLSPAQDIGAALKKVSFGMSDAMVGYLATASHHIERLGISNLKISGETVSVLDISFAINKNTPQLKEIINKVLDQTTQEQKKTILRKWISLEFTKPDYLKWVTRIVFPGIALVLFGLIAIIIWNRSLQRQVTHRTEKLNRELIQRTQMELALRESEEKYKSIFRNIQDVYYEILPEGRVLEISPSVEKVFGYKRHTLLGQSMSPMFVDPDEFEAMLEKSIKKGRLNDHETLMICPDGQQLNCSMNSLMILDDKGSPQKIIGSIHNITERVKAQRALRSAYNELEKRVRERTAELRHTNRELNQAKEAADAATKAKSHFLANMSHEIRTPLSGVISASELVMHESLPNKIARYIKIIRTSGHALLGVIDDILDFSKIEAGKLEIEVHPFELNLLINRISNLFKQKIAEKDIRFNIDMVPGTPVHLKGDSFRIQQILTNLLSNAVKFTDRGGSINIAISGEPCIHKTDRVFLEFQVKDSGIGIRPEHQELLFTPFSQVDASTTRKYGGSGLGLSICGQLIEMMEGTISVESSPETGSSFVFTIPLTLSNKSDASRSDTLSDHAGSLPLYRSKLAGKKILVAEDTPTNQEIILAVLELAQINTVLAKTGEQAVAAVQNDHFDAVLMDLQMPEMDGFEATRFIRLQKDKCELPIIAMTAHTLKDDEDKCMASGMNGYISKPVDQDKLFKTLIREIPEKTLDSDQSDFTDENNDYRPQAFLSAGLPRVIPGIEIETTMKQLGVSTDKYLHILNTFFMNHESDIEAIETAWKNGEKQNFIRLSHSLKGSALGIGATDLSEVARKLEVIGKSNDALPLFDHQKLRKLENELTIVLASIRTLALENTKSSNKTPESNRKSESKEALTVLSKLEKALAFPELGELELLGKELESCCSDDMVGTINGYIAAHDHDLARQQVKKFQSLLTGKTK
ncbi:MAG: transporter substrate-binding domain-containing protein [Desulfobacterales bacterium]|nr:transporter substrate-binding domain-containing protein [Desulfobacterales bacterium]